MYKLYKSGMNGPPCRPAPASGPVGSTHKGSERHAGNRSRSLSAKSAGIPPPARQADDRPIRAVLEPRKPDPPVKEHLRLIVFGRCVPRPNGPVLSPRTDHSTACSSAPLPRLDSTSPSERRCAAWRSGSRSSGFRAPPSEIDRPLGVNINRRTKRRRSSPGPPESTTSPPFLIHVLPSDHRKLADRLHARGVEIDRPVRREDDAAMIRRRAIQHGLLRVVIRGIGRRQRITLPAGIVDCSQPGLIMRPPL